MGAKRDIVEINHPNAKQPRQARISTNIRRAIELVVLKGEKIDEACKSVGITRWAYDKAFLKAEVRAFQSECMRVSRTNAASRTVAKAEKLMDSAESEHVQMDAVKWLAGLEGIQPVNKSEITHTHQGSIPGLTIVFGGMGPAMEHERQITDLALESGKPNGSNALPRPVPHPAMLNVSDAVVVDTPPASKSRGRRGAPGGQK